MSELIEMDGWVDHRVHHAVVTYHDITTWEGPVPHLDHHLTARTMVGRVFGDPPPSFALT